MIDHLKTASVFALGLAAHDRENDVVPGHFGAPLVPRLVTYGLAAKMLSVLFFVHNVVPGAQLFQSNIDLVYGLKFALIALNVIVIDLHIRTLVKEWRVSAPDEDHDLHDSQTR